MHLLWPPNPAKRSLFGAALSTLRTHNTVATHCATKRCFCDNVVTTNTAINRAFNLISSREVVVHLLCVVVAAVADFDVVTAVASVSAVVAVAAVAVIAAVSAVADALYCKNLWAALFGNCKHVIIHF